MLKNNRIQNAARNVKRLLFYFSRPLFFLCATQFIYAQEAPKTFPRATAAKQADTREKNRIETLQNSNLRVLFLSIGFPDLPTLPKLPPSQNSTQIAAELTPIIAVDSTYVLGAGDEIGIFFVGELQKEHRTIVHADGTIFLPPIGLVRLQGVAIHDAKILLEQKLRAYFENFTLHFSLLRPRVASVTVTGEVARSGAFSVSGAGGLLALLAQAGGVNPGGNLRDVQILQLRGQEIKVDLYQSLFDARNKQRIYLQGGARVHVPPAKFWIALTGEVHRPGIYQLSSSRVDSLRNALVWGGNLSSNADSGQIQLSRLRADGSRFLQKIDLDAGGNLRLSHGDIISVSAKIKKIQQAVVTIFGEVNAPGEHPFSSGMRASDLLRLSGGLKRGADLFRAELVRVSATERDTTILINLLDALNASGSQADPLLSADDQLFVRIKPGWDLNKSVRLIGEVVQEGVFSIEENQTRLSDVLRRAGGLNDEAFLPGARLYRTRKTTFENAEFERLKDLPPGQLSRLEYQSFLLQAETAAIQEINFDLGKLLDGSLEEDPFLQHGDVIEIPPKPELVFVAGRVARPGGVPFKQGENAAFYLAKAGGLTWDAAKKKARVVKASGAILKAGKAGVLEPGDAIWAPRKGDRTAWEKIRDTVSVLAQLATIYLILERRI